MNINKENVLKALSTVDDPDLKKDLVTLNMIASPQWKLSGQQGCCGIGTVSRLRANYPAPAVIMLAHKLWQERDDARLLDQRHGNDLVARVRNIQRFPYDSAIQVSTSIYNLPSNYFAATAVPQDIAYAMVLSQMLSNQNYGIWFLSDNVSGGHGDVHLGEFTTRGFVYWCHNNNLGTMQTTGPQTSRRTRDDIQGWMLTLHWDNCTEKVRTANSALTELIKEWNSDTSIKASGTAIKHQEATRRREFDERIGRAWAE